VGSAGVIARALALAAVVLLCAAVAPAFAQAATSTPGSVPPTEEQFDPGEAQEVEGTEPESEGETTEEPLDNETPATTEEEGHLSNETIQQAGWGSAEDQPAPAKEAEAAQDCQGAPPPVSKMLGLPATLAVREEGSLAWLVLAISGGALAVAGVAYVIRRQRGPTAARGTLETVATVVGILGGIAGLAAQFVPGVGVEESPAPRATMAVKDVNQRIMHDEYARKMRSERPRGADRREVGNVIWLEINLEGYREKDPVLQYALYDPGAGGALLPGTAKQVPIPAAEADTETRLLPVWVGYPLSEEFEAAFRLLDGNAVEAIAATGKMQASKYRYACPS